MANLASVILEGAGINSVTESVDTSAYDFSYVADEKVLAESAFVTLFTDIMEAEQEYMVSDVVGAATIIRESKLGNDVDPEAVTEAVKGNALDKIKNAFKKFLAVIKEFYNRVVNWFKAMFANAEKFESEYGKIVKDKASKTKGFMYEGYKYTLDSNKISGAKQSIQKSIDGQIVCLDKAKDFNDKNDLREFIASKLSGSFNKDEITSATDVANEVIKSLGYSDAADMRKTLSQCLRDGADKKHTVKDFADTSVDSMLSVLKTSNSKIDAFKTDEKKYEENVSKVISKLEAFKAKDDSKEEANVVSNASYIASILSALLNVYKIPCEVEIAAWKEATTSYLGVLKKFYRYKGNKGVYEGAEIFDVEAYATLESSLILEGADEDEPEGDGDGMFEGGKGCTESAIEDILSQASRFTF